MPKNDQPFSSTDPEQVAAAKEQAELIVQRRANQMRHTISHRDGRAVFLRLFEDAGIFRTSFTGNSTTFFNEGMRNIALKYLNEILEVDFASFMFMLAEHKEPEHTLQFLQGLAAQYQKQGGDPLQTRR
jgi:hypothetical protein